MRDLSKPLAPTFGKRTKTVTKNQYGDKTKTVVRRDGTVKTKTTVKHAKGDKIFRPKTKTKTIVTPAQKAAAAAAAAKKAKAAADLKLRNKQKAANLRKSTTSGNSIAEKATSGPKLIKYYQSQGMSLKQAVAKMVKAKTGKDY